MRRSSMGVTVGGLALAMSLAALAAEVAPPDADVSVTVTRGDPAGAPVTVDGQVSKPEGDSEDVVNYRVEGVPPGSQATVLRVSVKCSGVATNTTRFLGTGINKIGCNGNNGRLLERILNANSNPAGSIRIRADSGPGSPGNPAYVAYTLTFTAAPYRPN